MKTDSASGGHSFLTFLGLAMCSFLEKQIFDEITK